MLNLQGAFVVVFTGTVQCHVLGAKALADYYARTAIVGFLKTNQFTFGGEALFALPATLDCMTEIALNYPDTEPMAQLVRATCALIALGKPVGGDAPSSDNGGGLGVLADHVKPKAPKGGSGAHAKVSVRDRMDQALPASQI